jgi:pilus assembly protein CpaC
MKLLNAISTAIGIAITAGSLAAIAIPAAAAAAADEPELVIGVRDQRALDVPANLERIAIANPEVADVLLLRGSGGKKGSVLLVGKKPGNTRLTAWPRNGAAKVWNVKVLSHLQSLQKTPGENLNVSDDSALIGGQAPSLLSHINATAIAGDAVGKGTVLDTATIATGGVVQIDVKIVEFSKSVLKEAGFDFLFNLQRGGFTFRLDNKLTASAMQTPASSAFSMLTGINRGNFSLSANLRLIESNGLARVLAQPSLTALSGQSASFLAGGELPIPQSGGLGTTTIVYKPFGIGLTVTPTVLAANRIALKVAPESSDIDYTNALISNGIAIPAITVRRADTTLELGDGESFVIGGLVSRNTKSSVAKVPFLGDLPIIGTFFRSMSYSQDEKELVIIVTPHLVNPIKKGVELALPGGDKERRDSASNAWGTYLMGKAGRNDLPGFSK